ncbi:XRE family transcriptional regulator [Pedobacter frigidisoli]|uniref:XRE family transcriptional regulator n=1 Tax=Pedobacter frigidisoli TaxID=2530455 RepID=UPI00292F09F9|nr:XRE family transcriptional regulator [Pedobacter frigidisoli]
MSQRSLSVDMKLSKSFVGKVEALGQPEKYSVRHLWLIKDALKLEDIKDIFEGISVKHDLIEIVYEKIPKLNKDGKESKQFDEKVIEIRPIPKEDKGEKM